MQFFSDIENLAIDIANHFGLDKELFEDRIQWVKDNKHQLEALAPQAETKPLYIKAVMALRAAQRGEAVGHPIAFDGVCSGMQIMSAITGCLAGAHATGMVDQNRRADAYSTVTAEMNRQPGITVQIPRSHAKEAVMTSLYGSKDRPKKIFGEDTPELSAFYKSMEIVAPGAWSLLKILLDAWNPYATYHAWQLPDGFDVKVPVRQTKEIRVEVDELDHATFSYNFKVIEGSKKGLSLVANTTHSIDAYVLRSLRRRSMYDPEVVKQARFYMEAEMNKRKYGIAAKYALNDPAAVYYHDLYKKTGMPDVIILPTMSTELASNMSDLHIEQLMRITGDMLKHKPFQLITVHDAFASKAAYCNWVRWHYKEIMADLADSHILDYILSTLYKEEGTFDKLTPNLGDIIRQSNYALS